MTFVGLKCQCQDLEIVEPVASLTLRDCLSIIFQVIYNLVMFFFYYYFHMNDRWSHDAIERKSSPHVFTRPLQVCLISSN